MAPSPLVEVELAGPQRSACRRSPRGPGTLVLSLGLCDNCHRGPAALGEPGLVEVGPGPSRPGPVPGLVGPGRSPAAMGAPGSPSRIRA